MIGKKIMLAFYS